MRPLQMAFSLGNEPEPGPVLYLACLLTSVDEVTRQLVDSYCTRICATVTETTRDSERPWEVAVHAPVFWSNPARGDDRTPVEIYQLNSQSAPAYPPIRRWSPAPMPSSTTSSSTNTERS